MKAIVFDLDGTLCNTLEDIAASLNKALIANGIDPYSWEEIKGMIGHSMVYMCKAAMPPGRESSWKSVMDSYSEIYFLHLADHARLYDGMAETLQQLKKEGYLLAVVTNKPHRQAVRMLSLLLDRQTQDAFSEVQGQNSKFILKPDPQSLLFVLHNLGVEPEDALYVGDSDVDYRFAMNTGTHFCGCSWGYKGREVMEKLGSEFVIDRPEELLGVVRALS